MNICKCKTKKNNPKGCYWTKKSKLTKDINFVSYYYCQYCSPYVEWFLFSLHGKVISNNTILFNLMSFYFFTATLSSMSESFPFNMVLYSHLLHHQLPWQPSPEQQSWQAEMRWRRPYSWSYSYRSVNSVFDFWNVDFYYIVINFVHNLT